MPADQVCWFLSFKLSVCSFFCMMWIHASGLNSNDHSNGFSGQQRVELRLASAGQDKTCHHQIVSILWMYIEWLFGTRELLPWRIILLSNYVVLNSKNWYLIWSIVLFHILIILSSVKDNFKEEYFSCKWNELEIQILNHDMDFYVFSFTKDFQKLKIFWGMFQKWFSLFVYIFLLKV